MTSASPCGGELGLLTGMSMTEKQGGSDLGRTPRSRHRVDGIRWCRLTVTSGSASAPMNDVFLPWRSAGTG